MRHIKRICYILIALSLYTTNLFASPLSSGNYILSMPHIVSGGGLASSPNYFIKNASFGGTFGGIAESANYILHANLFYDDVRSISLNPTTWSMGSIKVGLSRITDDIEKIIISNDCKIKITYCLKVMDTAKIWKASNRVDGNGVNTYVLSAIFTGIDVTGVDEDSFNQSGNEDLVLDEVSQAATGTKFATAISTENGVGVEPNEKRALWLKFDAPIADVEKGKREHGQRNLWLIITTEAAR